MVVAELSIEPRRSSLLVALHQEEGEAATGGPAADGANDLRRAGSARDHVALPDAWGAAPPEKAEALMARRRKKHLRLTKKFPFIKFGSAGAKCTPWKKGGVSSEFSRCGNRVGLQVVRSARGTYGFAVTYEGRTVRVGTAPSMAAAKRAARKQAGAVGGVP